MVENRFWDNTIKHFKPEEFAAPENPTSGLLMNHFLIMGLDDLRSILGYSIHVHQNGGYSLKGHSANSYHYDGRAVDFHLDPASPLTPREQLRIILSVDKFGGVGFYPEWKPVPGFHVDVRERFQIWKKVGDTYVYFFT